MGDIADDLMDRALEELLEEQEYHRIERMLKMRQDPRQKNLECMGIIPSLSY